MYFSFHLIFIHGARISKIRYKKKETSYLFKQLFFLIVIPLNLICYWFIRNDDVGNGLRLTWCEKLFTDLGY